MSFEAEGTSCPIFYSPSCWWKWLSSLLEHKSQQWQQRQQRQRPSNVTATLHKFLYWQVSGKTFLKILKRRKAKKSRVRFDETFHFPWLDPWRQHILFIRPKLSFTKKHFLNERQFYYFDESNDCLMFLWPKNFGLAVGSGGGASGRAYVLESTVQIPRRTWAFFGSELLSIYSHWASGFF